MVRRRRDVDREQQGKDELADFAIHWVRLIGLVIGLTVVYLELKNTPLDGFARTFDNTSLIKIGLYLFYFGWFWGAKDDTDIQKAGYRRDVRLGEIGIKEWAGIFIFAALLITLFFIPDRLVLFQATLLALILVNFWTWRVIFDRTRSVILPSYEECTAGGDNRDTCSLAKLLLVVEYMNGSWQRLRFRCLILLAALQIPVAMLVQSGWLPSQGRGLAVNGVSGDVLLGYLPGAFFVLYVLISEVWMKIYRIRIFSDLRTIDWVSDNFTLSKRRGVPLLQPHLAGSFDLSPTSNRNYVGRGGPLRWFTSAS
jgi:hypothetical protein